MKPPLKRRAKSCRVPETRSVTSFRVRSRGYKANSTQRMRRRSAPCRVHKLTKSGHVYIVSNIGSFGENVYKIGLTRRLDPQDRIRELGDASVPFPFDVHAMVYSEDAPNLEQTLHRAFDNRRVNLVNMRKEFFTVSLSEVEQATQDHGTLEFTLAAEAEEYRKTLALREARETAADEPAAQAIVADAKTRLEQRKASWASQSA